MKMCVTSATTSGMKICVTSVTTSGMKMCVTSVTTSGMKMCVVEKWLVNWVFSIGGGNLVTLPKWVGKLQMQQPFG